MLVAAGLDPACEMVVLAAKRYLKMLDMAADPANEFYFSPAHVADYCSFVEKLEQVEDGNWRFNQRDANDRVNPKIILEPCQIWVECAIHGFRTKPNGERLVTRALEVIPRKNAKSLKLAAAALHEVCFGGLSPQITLAAATEDQTLRVFNPAKKMAEKDPELQEEFGLKLTAQYISCAKTDGEIRRLAGLGEHQDGWNPSLAVFDEGHAGSAGVYKVIRSADGARPNALLRMATTAGYRPEGPAWELIREAELILRQGVEDYSFFAAIYTLDDADYLDKDKKIDTDKLLSDVGLMIKANPMWGISITPAKILQQAEEAKRRPDKRSEFLRTRYNIWTSAGSALIQTHYWRALTRKIYLEEFIGQRCWIGVDLAQRLDMCAIGIIFELPGDILAVFAKYFLPELSPTALDIDLSGAIESWRDGGWLTMTEGPLADHDRVRQEIEILDDNFDVQVIGCDPHQAHNTAKQLWDGSRPVKIYPNNAVTMTGPTDDILGRVVAGRMIHDGNPVLSWNAANVHGERKGNGTIMPRKESENSIRKIDGFVALVIANGCRLSPDKAKEAGEILAPDPYLNRGIIGFDDRNDLSHPR